MTIDTPASPKTPLERVITNVGWLLAGKGVGAVLSLVYIGLATRTLGLAGFGQFTLVVSTGQAIAAIMSFQTWQIVVRFGVSHRAAERTDALGRLVAFCLALDLGAALVGCGIAAGGVALLAPRLGWSNDLAHEALLFCWVLLLSIRSTPTGILRLHDRYRAGAAADAVTPVARFAGAIAAVSLGASVRGFLIAWATAEVLTAAVYWFNARRVAPEVLRVAGGLRALRENPGLARFALVTNVNSTLVSGSRQVSVLLVGLLAGPVGAGSYRLAYQLAQSLTRVADIFARGVFPEFARAHAAGQRDDLARLLRQSTWLAGVSALAIALIVPLLGRPALLLVAGAAYVGAYPVVVLLGLAAALDVWGVGFEPALLSTGRAGSAFRIRLVVGTTLLAGLLLLVPRFDAVGAGMAALGASALGLGLFARAALRRTR